MNSIENLKDLIIYQSQNNENISVEVLYNEEDFWLTQKSMSKLFNVEENNITYHLQNIFKTRELEQDSVTQKIRVTASDGKKYNTNFYSLDAIIAVGYRVNSKEATDFRIWATKTLKEYIKKEDTNYWEYAAVSAFALKNYQEKEVKNILIEALSHPNWYVRKNAAISLAEMKLTKNDVQKIMDKKDKYANEILSYELKKQKKGV